MYSAACVTGGNPTHAQRKAFSDCVCVCVCVHRAKVSSHCDLSGHAVRFTACMQAGRQARILLAEQAPHDTPGRGIPLGVRRACVDAHLHLDGMRGGRVFGTPSHNHCTVHACIASAQVLGSPSSHSGLCFSTIACRPDLLAFRVARVLPASGARVDVDGSSRSASGCTKRARIRHRHAQLVQDDDACGGVGVVVAGANSCGGQKRAASAWALPIYTAALNKHTLELAAGAAASRLRGCMHAACRGPTLVVVRSVPGAFSWFAATSNLWHVPNMIAAVYRWCRSNVVAHDGSRLALEGKEKAQVSVRSQQFHLVVGAKIIIQIIEEVIKVVIRTATTTMRCEAFLAVFASAVEGGGEILPYTSQIFHKTVSWW